MGARFSRTIWEIFGVNTVQTVQNQQWHSHVLCHEEREGCLTNFFLYEVALLSGVFVFMWLKAANQMVVPFWIISSIVYGSTIVLQSLWMKKHCHALFIKIYIGKGRSQRDLRYVCVTPSFWLLIVYDMGEGCSALFHYYFHFGSFVSHLNLTWIICEVRGKSGIIQSLVEFITWVWEK